jgi:hypothetical protein
MRVISGVVDLEEVIAPFIWRARRPDEQGIRK